MTKINNYHFRQAYYNDIESIVEIARKTFKETYQEHFKKNFSETALESYLNHAFSMQKIKSEYADPNAKFYILKQDQTTKGYCKLTGFQNPMITTLMLDRIYLDKDIQGKGIGKEILEHVLEIAQSENKTKIKLHCWEDHTNSLIFYKKNGFQIIDKIKFQIEATKYEDTDYVLEKTIKRNN
ncbi:MAG: GNAT family N-acetyltransferase [Bdellovibrionaceae bacterium]|nr:GNAT family N-acetyltransferase [Pseudobdellovibrionaceae bacterium]